MDRRSRIYVLVAIVVVVIAMLAVQAATAPVAFESRDRERGDPHPSGPTLITVQSYTWFDRDNGQALVVDTDGDVVWRYDPPNTRIFDAEQLDNGTVLVTAATRVPAAECPPAHRDGDHCVYNRVLELDYETKRVVWNYSWYDAFMTHHEVHDADRLPSGETAIIDMGNNRAFTVNSAGEITWEWHAEAYIGPGTTFWNRYVPTDARDEYRKRGPESDWTHMNDIDRLDDGTFQLSIRNFDVIVTVDPDTNEIVDVIGRPGQHELMQEQHNPHRLERPNHLLVADSENNRVVEIDVESGAVVWTYTNGGKLQWPRDADRLPNGNTLVVDSRNFRVIEVDPSGATVWEHTLEAERGIVYDADRLSVPEEPGDVPPAGQSSTDDTTGPIVALANSVESWLGFVFPPWVGLLEFVGLVVGIVAAGWLVVELVRFERERHT